MLSTKGISTLLTLQWIEMFTEWITYPVIAVCISKSPLVLGTKGFSGTRLDGGRPNTISESRVKEI